MNVYLYPKLLNRNRKTMKTILLFALSLLLSLSVSDVCAQERVYDISQFGLKANSKKNASPVVRKAIAKIKAECRDGEKVILRFPAGRYNFHEAGSTVREYYISNHDQDNPKKVGIALEDMKNLTIDGQGSEFVFYGRMIPVSLLRSENCVLKNFSIDFEQPHIAQVQVVENEPEKESRSNLHHGSITASVRIPYSKDWVKAG